MTHPYTQDPDTGLMTMPAGSGSNLCTFGSENKLKFIEILKQSWPHIKKTCDIIGISTQTYRNHYNQDEVFRRMIDDIKEERLDNLEAVMLDNGEKPAGFLDRIAYLRAHRPHLYNPAQKVIVERQDHISIDVAQERVNRLRTVIDADIVETYDKRNLPPG